ncbi:MAG: hypothetical protein KA795_13800 [Burkholderiaceae bacterium]|nr:hypothetical protein [Burkholderiaceae bacterium]
MIPSFPTTSLRTGSPTPPARLPNAPTPHEESGIKAPAPLSGALGALSSQKQTAAASLFASPSKAGASVARQKEPPSLEEVLKLVGQLTGPMGNAIPASPRAVQRFAASQAVAKATLPDDVHDQLEKQLSKLFQNAMKRNGGHIDGALRTCCDALDAAVASYHQGAGVR